MNIQNLISKRKTNKIKFLSEQATQDKALIIALTETHLNENILEAEIHIPNYTIYRQDRVGGRRQGGIVTYVHNSVSAQCQLIKSFSNNYIEFNVIYFSELDVIFINLYRPPECPHASFEEAFQELKTGIENHGETYPTIILTGDLNFPKTNWSSSSSSEARGEDKNQAELIIQLSSDLLCTQIIEQPTRNNNILDLFFVNNEEIVREYFIENTTASDHNVITVETNLNVKQNKVDPRKSLFFNKLNFNHKKTDWSKIQSSINETEWETILSNKDPEQQYDIIHSMCLDICTEYTPKRNKLNRKKKIPYARRALMRTKRKLAKRIKLNANNPQNVQSLNEKMSRKDAQIQNLIKNEEIQEEMRVIESIKINPKCFFTYASRKSKIKSGIGPLRNEANEIIEDPEQMTELLKEQYESVFTQPVASKMVNDPQQLFSTSEENDLTDIAVNEEVVTMAIKTLKTHSAPGPDEFPAILLKNCVNELAKPLTLLYRNMLDTGIVPQDLKTAHITPIHKKGSKSQAKNYRPVALTSHIIKIFEKVFAKQLAEYLENNNKMNPTQHGFRPGRSCLSQLLSHYDSIITSLEKGYMKDVTYLGYSKAFDTVDHGILLHRVKKNLGFPENWESG